MRKRPKITEYRFDQWAEDLKGWIQESVSPFEDDTPEKQTGRKARAKWDKLFFMKTYLPHYFFKPFAPLHEEWAELGDLRDECAFVAAPREFGKSTFFSFGDPLHDICYELRHFIEIISDTHEQATMFTLAIKVELEDNPRIHHDFGDLKGRTWREDEVLTSNNISLLARGKKDKFRSLKNRQWRPDKIIPDDFENDENVQNPKLVKKAKALLQGAVMGSAGEGFCFLMVGNIFHPKSVLAQFMAEKDEDGKSLYISKIYRAIIDQGKPTERSSWPELWPLERLYQKRRMMSTMAFNIEMMNLTGAEDSPFKEEWFKYYNRDEIDLTTLQVATGVDPSSKQGEANDFKAIITVGLDREKMHFYCLHAWIRHASPGGMFRACYHQVDDYGGRIGIEENMLEDFLHEAIYNYAKDVGRYLTWQGIKHLTNKEQRIIGTLQYLVEHGKMFFEKGHSDQDLLVEQLIYILNKNIHDDGPDGLEEAVSMLQGTGIAACAGREPEKRETLSRRQYGMLGRMGGVLGRWRKAA